MQARFPCWKGMKASFTQLSPPCSASIHLSGRKEYGSEKNRSDTFNVLTRDALRPDLSCKNREHHARTIGSGTWGSAVIRRRLPRCLQCEIGSSAKGVVNVELATNHDLHHSSHRPSPPTRLTTQSHHGLYFLLFCLLRHFQIATRFFNPSQTSSNLANMPPRKQPEKDKDKDKPPRCLLLTSDPSFHSFNPPLPFL